MFRISRLVGAVVVCAASVACGGSPATFTEQAELGQELYGESCAKCHGAGGEGGQGPRLVGLAQGALPLDPPATAQKRTGKFVTVADVAAFVTVNMPGDAPGSLSEDEYLEILAFDLKANGIDLAQEKLTLEKAKSLTIPR
ncbi:MAG: c-type cytochrome [Deltaproteobacteria bacterium]|nr:c-type cytochrome [Deltaproteobacteria bacterium]